MAYPSRIMLHDRMIRSLQRLGLNDSNYKVLKLLPLVYVAWSNGKMEAEQQERLVELAHDHFSIGPRGEELLREWIHQRPSPQYFAEGLKDVVFLARAPDDWGFDVDELQGLLLYAEEIARCSAEAMGAPSAVDAKEQQALRDIARELQVDDGESWAELIAELS